jgi:hypothetical protein
MSSDAASRCPVTSCESSESGSPRVRMEQNRQGELDAPLGRPGGDGSADGQGGRRVRPWCVRVCW